MHVFLVIFLAHRDESQRFLFVSPPGYRELAREQQIWLSLGGGKCMGNVGNVRRKWASSLEESLKIKEGDLVQYMEIDIDVDLIIIVSIYL